MSKINSIDFGSEIEIYKLKKDLFDINDFECSNSEYENYIKDEAYEDQKNSIAQTWVFVYKNQNIVGYVSIAMGDLNKTQHKKLNNFPHTNVPGILLGRLATHKKFEDLRIGQNMVNWVFSEAIHYAKYIGCRILYLNPEQGVEQWYSQKMKFIHIKNKHKDDVMFYDLQLYKNNH